MVCARVLAGGVIKNGTCGGRGSSSREALENFLKPRRGRMFIESRSLRCQPRKGWNVLRQRFIPFLTELGSPRAALL